MPKKKKSDVVKPRNGGKWSESEYFSRIRASLRRVFRYWNPMVEALNLSRRPNESENKRLKWEFQCNKCKNWFKREDVQIDHIEECGSLTKYEDIVPFLKRLTKEEVEAYQVLCKPCHKEKSSKFVKIKRKK